MDTSSGLTITMLVKELFDASALDSNTTISITKGHAGSGETVTQTVSSIELLA